MSIPSWWDVPGLIDRPTVGPTDRARSPTSRLVSASSQGYLPGHVMFDFATEPQPWRRPSAADAGRSRTYAWRHVGEASPVRLRDPFRPGFGTVRRPNAARQGERHDPSVRTRASPTGRRARRSGRAGHLCCLWLSVGRYRRRLVPFQPARRARRPGLPHRVCRRGARHERPCDLGERLTLTL